MTTADTSTLVFKDQAGEYYLVPQETLEQGRVPEEHKAEIEHLLAEQQDVQGYTWWMGFLKPAPVQGSKDPRTHMEPIRIWL